MSLGARKICSLTREFEDTAHPAVLPAVWPGRGPSRQKEGVNHHAEQKRAGLEGAGPGGCRPGSPLAPPSMNTPHWAHHHRGAPSLGTPAFEAWQFGVP